MSEVTSAVDAAVRLAARLVDQATPLLYRAGAEPLLLHWPAGPAAPALELDDPLARSLCAAALAGAEPFLVPDVRADLRFRRELAREGGTLAFAGVPLGVAGGAPAEGVFAVLAEGARVWTEEEARHLADLAALVAAELGRVRSHAEAEQLRGALAHSDARYERLLASSPGAVFMLDGEGCLAELNPAAAAILDRPAEALVGAAFETLVAPEDLDLAARTFTAAMSGREPAAELELRVLRPTGERRLVRIDYVALEENGRVTAVRGTARDLTEERAREMQMRRAERMASVAPLLSGVCHELNNPLTSIKSFAELLLMDERPQEDREALEIVQREAHRAAKIVSDLRVVARQSQEAGAGRGMVHLGEVVRHVVELRSGTLATHGVQVVLDLAPDLPPAWAVRSQVEQVVLQLVGNAEQALLEGTRPRTLTLRTYAGDLGVALRVTDTGTGIAPENLDRIFDPFWTTRRPGEGTGLGLSLVHGIVSDHGGRIQVDSHPGRGTSFVVDLPVAHQPPVALGECENGPASRNLRILVVDDEAPIRFSLARYMERRGHRVEEAAEGGAALRLIEGSTDGASFDIIVADLRMPGLDGEQLFDRLCERRDGLEQRLIFITGDADSPDVDRVLRDAGVPVVWKPFELAEVAQIIETQAGMTTPP